MPIWESHQASRLGLLCFGVLSNLLAWKWKTVNRVKSYVKDTTEFINEINHIGELSENSYLVAMDVKALYSV